MSSLKDSVIPHPYYPLALSLPHYTLPVWSMSSILTIFFSSVGLILLVAYILISRKPYPFSRRLIFLWFLLCGFIHFVVEGYFAYNHVSIAGQTTFLADLWKEYALGDSRYMSADPFVVVMESFTAVFWGLGSFLTAYTIYINHPIRHILQFLISMGQMYGDVLYYATTLFEGSPHCSPHPFHFWFYFITLNGFWIVIPLAVMYSSGKVMYHALVKEERSKSKKN
ncbi:hypothetical protein HDV00_012078 [Rhizophlyctis rosea]|nr:hypothetical protein HDV00_012078 [Rhizophlyctis rosea]